MISNNNIKILFSYNGKYNLRYFYFDIVYNEERNADFLFETIIIVYDLPD